MRTLKPEGTSVAQPTPIDMLLDRIRAIVGDANSARLLPELNDIFEQFELVPKRQFDQHLASLTELQQRIKELETRLQDLETG